MLALTDPPLDFVALATGMGVPATRATTADELVDQLGRSFAQPGPSLIEAVVPARSKCSRPPRARRGRRRRRAGGEPTEPEAKAKGLGPTFVAVMAVVFVAGALLRWWILGHDAMNADEAVVGLVARGILAGHPTAFVWHQAYGGVEPFAVAGMFGLFGSSPLTLNLTPVLLSAAVAALTWRVGLRLFTQRAALAAAALAWIWPESGVFNSTREYGYHEAALVFGMVVLLFTVRLAQRRPTPQRPFDWRVLLDWAVLGLAAGAGWWASPEIVYFVLPAAVVLLCTTLRRPLLGFAAGVATAAVTFALGVLPWVLAGVDDRWATIRTVRGATRTPGSSVSTSSSTTPSPSSSASRPRAPAAGSGGTPSGTCSTRSPSAPWWSRSWSSPCGSRSAGSSSCASLRSRSSTRRSPPRGSGRTGGTRCSEPRSSPLSARAR